MIGVRPPVTPRPSALVPIPLPICLGCMKNGRVIRRWHAINKHFCVRTEARKEAKTAHKTETNFVQIDDSGRCRPRGWRGNRLKRVSDGKRSESERMSIDGVGSSCSCSPKTFALHVANLQLFLQLERPKYGSLQEKREESQERRERGRKRRGDRETEEQLTNSRRAALAH